MVEKVELIRAKDGEVFKYKRAAQRYERGLLLGEEIKALPKIDAKTEEYLENNWGAIIGLVNRFGTVLPNEDVPDERKIQDIR